MKKNLLQFSYLFLSLLILISCELHRSPAENFHPMVDGWNTEYNRLNINPIELSEDVSLFIFQNNSYVWISYDYPIGSFGTLDMIIESPKLESALNLHVSAQLGEWPINNPEKKPKSATSDLWWKINGWTANNLWVNGIDTISYDTPEFKIRNGDIRELQLSKERFGKGEWKVKLKINAIKSKDGGFYSIDFPKDSTYFSIQVK